jgi:ATP synthase protein I
MAAGRRLARRAAILQLLLLTGLALLLLPLGWRFSAALLLGGLALTLGQALVAWRGLGATAPAAGSALLRIIAGLVMKWALVLAALVLGMAVWQLPPLALIGGIAAAGLAFMLAAATRI